MSTRPVIARPVHARNHAPDHPDMARSAGRRRSRLARTAVAIAAVVAMRDGRVGALCVGILPVLALALTGCAPWIAANPQFASDSASNPGAAPTTAEAGGPPGILAPRKGLTWENCTPE